MINDIENYKDVVNTCPKCGSTHVQMDMSCVLTSYPPQYAFKCKHCDHTWTGFEVRHIQPATGWPNLEPAITVEPLNYGWICPKCGRVYSPSTSQCLFCGGTYSPNIVYCGPNSGTREQLDTMTLNNTVDGSKNHATQKTQSNSLKYESFIQQHGE
jgi:uncharacterized OB-fold protein